jgi:hypothetical protein
MRYFVADWLKRAEIVDALRIGPRLLLLLAYIFVAVYVFMVSSQFYELIQLTDITDWKLSAFSAFAAITIPAVVGLATSLTKVYLNSGRKWEDKDVS